MAAGEEGSGSGPVGREAHVVVPIVGYPGRRAIRVGQPDAMVGGEIQP